MLFPDKDEVRLLIIKSLEKQASKADSSQIYNWGKKETEIDGFFDLDKIAEDVVKLFLDRQRKMVNRLIKSDPKGFLKVGMAVMQAVKKDK